VVHPHTDPHIPADAVDAATVVASGPGAHRGPPWLIALDPRGASAGDPHDPEGFLPAALEGGNRGSSPGMAREFVMLRWDVPPPSDDGAYGIYDYYTVLIEVSLLTEEQRAAYLPDGLESAS
jgi:hypothetical protein